MSVKVHWIYVRVDVYDFFFFMFSLFMLSTHPYWISSQHDIPGPEVDALKIQM